MKRKKVKKNKTAHNKIKRHKKQKKKKQEIVSETCQRGCGKHKVWTQKEAAGAAGTCAKCLLICAYKIVYH